MTGDLVVRPGFLTPAEQQAVVRDAFAADPGFYTPVLRTGAKMRLRMNCLGRHWNAVTYRYAGTRDDVDGRPAAPVPPRLQRLARRGLTATVYVTGRPPRFDVCIANWYDEAGGRLGLHRDNSESSDAPVVSLSVGATALFVFGGTRRSDPKRVIELASGDLVVFGRSLRLAYHGVRRLVRGTTPEGLGLPGPGRLNLTFRVL